MTCCAKYCDLPAVEKNAPDPSLDELLAKVGLEDRRAFDRLYELASPQLYGVAYAVLGDADEAQDVVQEAFISIWRRAATQNAASSRAISWMVIIVRNAAVDRRRRRRNVSVDPAHLERVCDAPTPEENAVKGSEAAHLHRCLQLLEAGQAKLVRRAFFFGQTYAEIASDIEAPLGTVKSRMRRSFEKLRECLIAQVSGPGSEKAPQLPADRS